MSIIRKIPWTKQPPAGTPLVPEIQRHAWLHWPMRDASTRDASGNGRNITFNGTPEFSKVSKADRFGPAQHMRLGNDATVPSAGMPTGETANFPVEEGSIQFLFLREWGTSTGVWPTWLWLEFGSSRHIQAFYHNSNNEWWFNVATTSGGFTAVIDISFIPPNEWVLIHATWSVIGDEAFMYIDGELVGTISAFGSMSGGPKH